MHTRRATLLTAAVVVLLLVFPLAGSASSYPAVFVYGDSLSDNGNLFAASGFPPPPYYNGRFSNGPVAVEQLAAQLSAPLFDFAWGGATTGVGNLSDGGSQTSPGVFNLPGMLVELAAAPVPPALVPDSLFVVWGGANDFQVGGSAAIAVTNVLTIVGSLQAAGATHILVPGLPDLGLTPEFYGSSVATQFSQQFNLALAAGLPADAIYFDVAGLLNSVIGNPGVYGFSNVTDACFNGVSVCSDPSQYLYWDQIHPTTAADAILARGFRSAAAPIPEPTSILLLGSGAAGMLEVLRRRRAAQRL